MKIFNIFKTMNKLECCIDETSDQIEILDERGNIKYTDIKVAKVIDCIFCMLASSNNYKSIHDIHLELFRCNIYVQHPGLKKLLQYLNDEGYIKCEVTSF